MKYSLRVPESHAAQELVRHTRDALPAAEFGALRRGVLALLEARSRELAEEGSTRCLYCIHLVFNMAGASQPCLKNPHNPNQGCLPFKSVKGTLLKCT